MLRYVGLQQEDGSGLRTEDLVEMIDCQGAGYGVNRPEEIGESKTCGTFS